MQSKAWLLRIGWFDIAILLAIAALTFLLLNPDDSLPAFLLVSSRSPERSLADEGVGLILIGRRPGPVDNVDELSFVLVNDSARAIYYSGYSGHHGLGRISPLYAKEIKQDDGWSEKAIHCGNGVDRMRLKPGYAGKFTAHIKYNEPIIRIGVRYNWLDDEWQTIEGVVWSVEIPYEGKDSSSRPEPLSD